MRIKLDALSHDLNKSLKPIYLVSGDEPLQQMEAVDLIRKTARSQGFTERLVFHVERGFDWGEILLASNSMSLFAEKKIIELRMSSCKPGDTGSKALLEYCQRLNDDNLLLISMPKLDAATQRTKWFKQFDKTAVIIPIWPIEMRQLPSWIAARMKARQLTPAREATLALAEKVEGNMLAAAQEIDKLAINAPTNISLEDIFASVEDAAKFDVFKLVDAILMAKVNRITRILYGLKAIGEEPLYILWALSREARMLTHVSYLHDKGETLPSLFKKNGVWDKRVPLVRAALTRLDSTQWALVLQKITEVDSIIKGAKQGNVWDALLDLSLSISGEKQFALAN